MTEPQQLRKQSVEEVYDRLLEALRRKQPVCCVYEELERFLCPHVLGTNRAGQRRMFCYQYGGDSRSGLQPPTGAGNWRCLAVDKVDQVRLLHQDWRTEAHRPQRCVEQVEADVDQPEP